MSFTNNKTIIGFTIVACFGLFVTLIGSIFAVKMIFLDVKDKESTYAEIVNIDNSRTTVRYIVAGKEYKKRYSAYSSTYYVGKKIKIYYNKAHPQKSTIANLRYLILIAPGMGLITTGIGGIGLLVVYMKTDKYKLTEH